MDWGQIEAGWNDYKSDFQRRWSRISAARLAGTHGRRAPLVAEVQRAYGIGRVECEAQIFDWQLQQLERQPLPIMK